MLSGTVWLGLDDPYVALPGDPKPLIAVPLASPEEIGTLSREQARLADGIVLIDPSELSSMRLNSPNFPPTLLASRPSNDHQAVLLRGPGPFDALALSRAIRQSPSLWRAVTGIRGGSLPSVDVVSVADAVIEMVVACSETGNGHPVAS